MQKFIAGIVLAMVIVGCGDNKKAQLAADTVDIQGPVAGISTDDALVRLMAGNKRYLEGQSTCGWNEKKSDNERREQLATTQKPFAVILGCSDSRVPPEIIFDQRLGDLFVIRVAGNVVDDVVLGSIEYAVEHLAPLSLVLVLGHERCGAVAAAVKFEQDKEHPQDHITSILQKIEPAVERAKEAGGGKNLVDAAVTANVKGVVEQLKNSTPHLVAAVKEGRLKVVGGCYDLDTGKIAMVA